MTNDLTTIEKELHPIAQQATILEIVDDSTLKAGVELLSRLNQYNDSMQAEKEKVTKPLNEALKAERLRFKPLESVYNDAITIVRSKMTIYQSALVKAQQEAQNKLASKVSSGYMKPETAVTKLENLPTVEKEHATDVGLVQFREKKQLLITNQMLIPREYLMPDEDKIMKDLKDSKVISGCELETIQVPVNYR